MTGVQTCALPIFVSANNKVNKSKKDFDQALRTSMGRFIDAFFVATGKRDEATCKAVQKAIMDSDIVRAAPDNRIDDGIIKQKTWKEYASGAVRALHYNVPFTADLKNKPEFVVPWSTKKAKAPEQKAGVVTQTSRAELDKTISKALAQARLIGLTEFAAAMLDLAIESLSDFKETVLDK